MDEGASDADAAGSDEDRNRSGQTRPRPSDAAIQRVGRPVDFLSMSTLPDFAPLFAQRAQLAGIASAAVTRSGVLEVLRNARLIESLRLPALEMSETVIRAMLGPSMLSANLAAQMAEVRLSSVLKDINFGAMGRAHASVLSQVEAIRRVAGLVEQQNSALSELRPQVDVARSAAFATRAWDDVVRVSRPERSPGFLDRLEVAGRGTGWTVQAGLQLSEADEEHRADLLVEAVAILGPAKASAELRTRLGDVHPSLRERLDGAWERITGGGADAASQAANSLMETVDWTLRTLAPDEDVLSWHASEGRPQKELQDHRPTRTLRVRYVVRQHPEKNSALDLYLKALGELVRAVQAPKHGLELHAPQTLVPVALSVEGLLHLLLVD